MLTLTIVLAAAFSGELIVKAIVWLLAAGLIYWLLTWAINRIAPDEPFRKLCDVGLVLLVLVLCLNAIFMVVGKPFIDF